MATDHIRYDILAQAALRGVVRTVLADAAKKGLPGEHHFKITFNTTAPGVRLSERMRARYPKDMTIVLQHQFWDLAVTEQAFEVGKLGLAHAAGMAVRERTQNQVRLPKAPSPGAIPDPANPRLIHGEAGI